MRRCLKIKVSIIGFAWLVIFLHSAIPHNHTDDLCSSNYEIVHSDCPDIHDFCEDDGCLLTHSDSESKVCHFSTNPFLKAAIDYHFLSYSYSYILSPEESFVSYIICCESDILTPPLSGSLTLRGPPSA